MQWVPRQSLGTRFGVAGWSFRESLLTSLAAFADGWAIHLLGHAFEGKRPALADNILQIFNAPLFLSVQVFFPLGYRSDLRRPAQAAAAPLLTERS